MARHRNRRQRAEGHQLLTIAGDHHHPLARLGLCDAKPDQSSTPHRAPKVVIPGHIARRMHVIAGRAKARDHQRAIAHRQKFRHGNPAVHRPIHPAHHFFLPSKRCPISTAIC